MLSAIRSEVPEDFEGKAGHRLSDKSNEAEMKRETNPWDSNEPNLKKKPP